MANVFLSKEPRDIETALLLEQAIVHDIDKAVAYTDGRKVFINTEDNLYKILPAYNHDMLKWLLWHEKFHLELRHHNRFFKYLHDLDEEGCIDKFQLSKNEVNIIMDILVHDTMSKLFPEIVPTAKLNLAQMRDQNSLKYTFKTFTLEEMLDEYKSHKKGDDKKEGSSSDDSKDKKDDSKDKKEDSKSKDKKSDDDSKDKKESKSDTSKEKSHKEGGHHEDKDDSPMGDKDRPEIKPDEGHHDETDWSKLDELNSKEFITRDESDMYMREVEKLRRTKIQLGRITETLNGLVTSTRTRTYSTPSRLHVGNGIIMKGRKNGKAKLYLCFDASGSMGRQLETFKEVIKKSVPQALQQPCEWFTDVYGKGTFKDILGVEADSGFSDDGDRTIELCYKAEQKGYSPIGVTDGGGQISWSKDQLKKLQRTILVGQNKSWLDEAKQINPRVQTLYIGEEW